MKILAFSLLRMGDLLMHQFLFRAIKAKYPGCELHVVIHDECRAVQPIIENVDRWFVFPRKVSQIQLVEDHYPSLNAYRQTHAWIQELSSQNYDALYNLTHDHFSARLSGFIQASVKKGALSGSQGFYLSDSKKMHELNERYVDREYQLKNQRHYLEVLSDAFDLPIQALPVFNSDTEIDQKIMTGQILNIAFQISTNEQKKTFSTERWVQMIQDLESSLLVKATVMLAPQEKELFQQLSAAGVNTHICSFAQARSFLLTQDLLVTVDTAMAHLANGLPVAMLGVYLGSASQFKTPPYGQGHWILHSKLDCFPCLASKPCENRNEASVFSCHEAGIEGLIAEFIFNGRRSTEPSSVFGFHQTQFIQTDIEKQKEEQNVRIRQLPEASR